MCRWFCEGWDCPMKGVSSYKKGIVDMLVDKL